LPSPPTVSVVICAYTEDRWSQLKKSVASVEAQTSPPIEIIVCIDHNEMLFRKSEEGLAGGRPGKAIPLIVTANKYNGRLGSARNTAAEFARGEVLAFLDDDAAAAPDWLERLIAPYDDKKVGAVGGAPLPVFEVRRPRWFPHEFDWVFGCAYKGLPLTRAPLAHLIGANMSVRRSALQEVGGFHSDDHDDMDMCHRIAFAHYKVIYEPLAVVRHFVPAARATWRYFWRRCYFVNRSKVEAFADMQEAAHLGAELAFVIRTVTTGVPAEVRQISRGDPAGLVRAGAIMVGITLAGAGHVSGKLRLYRSRRRLLGDSSENRIYVGKIDDPGGVDGNRQPGYGGNDAEKDKRIQPVREKKTRDEAQAFLSAVNRKDYD
jgi:glucosyl-dolichyl phosphate glucuronosyltransferase